MGSGEEVWPPTLVPPGLPGSLSCGITEGTCLCRLHATQPSAGFNFPHCGPWRASPPSVPSTPIKGLVRSSSAQVQRQK